MIPEQLYNELIGVNPLRKANKKLFGVGNNGLLAVVGMFTTVLQGKTTATKQNIYVVRGIHKALLGNPAIDALDLFNGLGKMEGPYTITLKENAQPFAVNVPRRVALPLMEKTKRELKRMEALGVISKVEQPTDWCAPMVVVPKSHDDVRICVDLTKLNESVRRERYEMPSVDYTLGQLAGAKIFSKLDANSGFWQVPLSEESTLLTTFITPFGRFAFRRLPFGISSAPEHYQRRMSAILEGIPGVLCQMDDVLVFGATRPQHDQRLHEVLSRLQQAKVTLNTKKCQFSIQHVTFLGQMTDASGIHPDREKIRAILDMPEPVDVS